MQKCEKCCHVKQICSIMQFWCATYMSKYMEWNIKKNMERNIKSNCRGNEEGGMKQRKLYTHADRQTDRQTDRQSANLLKRPSPEAASAQFSTRFASAMRCPRSFDWQWSSAAQPWTASRRAHPAATAHLAHTSPPPPWPPPQGAGGSGHIGSSPGADPDPCPWTGCPSPAPRSHARGESALTQTQRKHGETAAQRCHGQWRLPVRFIHHYYWHAHARGESALTQTQRIHGETVAQCRHPSLLLTRSWGISSNTNTRHVTL